MTVARSRRVFFALWPDDAAIARLTELAQDLTARGGGRVMRPVSLHLTLAFVGAVAPAGISRLEDLAAAVRAESFELSLDRLGFWPQRGILWVGCHQPPMPLRRLAGVLASHLRAAGFAIDPRSGANLEPHITLVRHAHCTSLPERVRPIRWRVGEFALVESHLQTAATSYGTLARFPLAEAAAG